MEQKLVDLGILKCHLCQNFPRDPVEMSCCSALCCWECLMNKPFEKCSSCGSNSCDIESSRPSKIVQKLIDSMMFTCEVCKEVFGSRDLLAAHLKPVDNNVNNENQIGEESVCPLSLRPCKYSKFGCNEMLGHAQMEVHLKEGLQRHLDMLAKSFDTLSHSESKNVLSLSEVNVNTKAVRHSCFCRALNRLLPQPINEESDSIENSNENCGRKCCKLALLVPLVLVIYLLKFSFCQLILLCLASFLFFQIWRNLRKKCDVVPRRNQNRCKKNRNLNKPN